LISYYFYPNKGRDSFDKQVFVELIKTTPTLGYYVNVLSVFNKLLLKYNLSKVNIGQNIDYFLRYENIEEDFKELCYRIEIPLESIPRLNSSKRAHYREYYDDELNNMVYKKYKSEIEYFNYEF